MTRREAIRAAIGAGLGATAAGFSVIAASPQRGMIRTILEDISPRRARRSFMNTCP